MSIQDNTQLAQSIYAAFNTRAFDQALALADEQVELILVPFGQNFRGRGGFHQFMQGFVTGFPDITVNLTNQVVTDHQVVSEFIARGTHTGPLLTPAGTVPATGRSVEYPVIEVWAIKGGRLAGLRNYFDAATLMRQLGLLPDPAPAPATA